ncbi:DUF3613 domain-containing protein [Achromobacter aegrifaciens]
MTHSTHRALFTLACALAALAPAAGLAQSNAPLTGSMSGAASSAQPASVSAPASPPAMPDRPVVQQVQTPMPQAQAPAAAAPAAEENFGDVTRGLLAAQADGRRAGNALPVLGPVSTAAWNRYLESFRRPIPEWFDRNVEIPNTN